MTDLISEPIRGALEKGSIGMADINWQVAVAKRLKAATAPQSDVV